MSVFGELSRRNVFRVGIAYVIATWLFLQVADLVLENIGSPDWVIQTIMLVAALGFPIALIFSWAYEVTPEGIKREAEVDRSASITNVTGRKLDRTIMVFLALGLIYFVWESRVATAPTTETVPAANATTASNSVTNADSMSIAVLPFDNRSNREEDEFFAIGMHDDLLTTLAKIGSLKVISRTSVMEYRDTTKKIPEIAEELGVANILEGGVQRSGNQVRINMQLIDAATDEHLWAEIYDRELTAENLFAIQSEISEAIAIALHATLSPDERRRINTAPTNNLAALDAYRRGRQLMETREATKLARALVEFRKAVELDPRFALAWVGVADTANHLNSYGTMSVIESNRITEHAVNQALAINRDLGEAHASKTHVLRDQGRASEAEESLRRAMEFSPNYATSYHWMANMLRDKVSRLDEALEFALKSVELDPRSRIIGANLAGIYQRKGDYQAAIRESNRIISIDPGFALIHNSLGSTYALTGELRLSLSNYATASDFDTGGAYSYAEVIHAYLALHAIAEAKSVLDTLQQLAPDHMAARNAKLLYSAAIRDRAGLKDTVRPRPQADWDLNLSGYSAMANLLLGDNEGARDATLASNPTQDMLQSESWPELINADPASACIFAYALIQTGDIDNGQALLAETLRHFEAVFPLVTKHVDALGPDICYLAAGDGDKALDVIEQQFEHGHFAEWWLTHQLPIYDPVRAHPRYVAVHQKYDRRIAELRESAVL